MSTQPQEAERGQALGREGWASIASVGMIGTQVEFANQNRIFEALEKSWGLVDFNFLFLK